MKRGIVLVSVLLIISGFIFNANADTISESYRKAIETGDYGAAYKAQSYLAPPFCYDLNLMHGMKFIKAVNGRVINPTYAFTYQEMTHPKVLELRNRVGIDDFIKQSDNDLELIQMICDWANIRYGHLRPLPFPAWDALEILDRIEKGETFFCTYKSALFVQTCSAAGLTARMVGINRKHGNAHTVTEVYNNDFRKWMLVDPWMNCYYERDGVPLSARELHNSMNNPGGVSLVFGPHGRGLEYWNFKAGKSETIPHAGKSIRIEEDSTKGLIDLYYDIRFVLRNDHTVHPQGKENRYVDGFMVPYNPRGGEWWGPQLKWTDAETPPVITSDNTCEINDYEWPLNEVKVDLRKVSLRGEPLVLKAHFTTLTPCFCHYEIVIDGREVPVDGDVYIWELKEGVNSLKITSINTAGRRGFPSEFVIDYAPDSIAPPDPVTVELLNPGMEEIDVSSSDGNRKPAHWRATTPNAFRFKEFTTDSKVKHSGKYALKVTPASDPETGVEYAFLARSEDFDVNPSTNLIYTVWLKSSVSDNQLDIFLYDVTRYGLGPGLFVKRVTVGKSWKQYELKCRLNNELTKAFIGFKPYHGTIWADDANLVEVKR